MNKSVCRLQRHLSSRSVKTICLHDGFESMSKPFGECSLCVGANCWKAPAFYLPQERVSFFRKEQIGVHEALNNKSA
jgi:hypothetical protein